MNAVEVRDLAEGLPAKFQYQFERCRLGADITPGWALIFGKLCKDVDDLLGADKRGFSWDQVKEKWGSARFYFTLDNLAPDTRLDVQSPTGAASLIVKPKDEDQRSPEIQQLTHQLRNLILEAEKATQHACAMCGAPGELDRGRGHFLTLCEKHKALRKAEGGLGDDLWIIVHPSQWSAGQPTNLPGKKSTKQPAPNVRKDLQPTLSPRSYADYMLGHFGYQFSGDKPVGIAAGWKRVFVDLCDRIDKDLGDDKRGFQWTQINEQFGAASFHFEINGKMPGAEGLGLFMRLRKIVAEVENKTTGMCIVCGEHGQIDRSEPHVLVLCDKHAGDGRKALEWIELSKDRP